MNLKFQQKYIKTSIQQQNFVFEMKTAGEWIFPYVIEPSACVERGVLAVLCEAYTEEQLENAAKEWF
jgi:glycyl-tRNA synthetase